MLRGSVSAAGGVIASVIAGVGCGSFALAEDSAAAEPGAVHSSASWQPLEHQAGYTHSTALPYIPVSRETVGKLKHVIVFAWHGDRSIVRRRLGATRALNP